MSDYYKFTLIPQDVAQVDSNYRKIATKIPVPESLPVFAALEKLEASSMHNQLPVVWDRAVDFQVFDRYGNCWIDFTSTVMVTNAGHGNPHIISALREELDKPLLHTYVFASEAKLKFLKKLVGMLPQPLEKAILLSGGAEASERAIKLMRLHGMTKHKSRNAIISFQGAMHGRTMGSDMLSGDAHRMDWIGFRDPNMYCLPFPYPWNGSGDGASWAELFYSDIEHLKANGLQIENICGFIMESYAGWGGVFYPQEYMRALYDFAKQNEILLTFDEIQAGFGRTGKLFSYQHYGVEADLVTLGKGISSSLPLSAVVGRKAILDAPRFAMTTTHGGNPLSCVAGLANLEYIESSNLIEESQRKGEILHSRLDDLRKRIPDRITYIGGKGMVAAVIFKEPATGRPDRVFASRVCEKAMQKGLLVMHTGREAVKLGPPLTIPDEALLEGIDVLEETIQALCA